MSDLANIIRLIDEVNERGESRRFYGIGQVLHCKLCTIRYQLLLADRLARENGGAK